MNGIGRVFIFIGIVLILIGGVFILAQRLPWIGKLPGDIYIKKDNFTFYFPIATSILISIAVSLVIFLLGKR